MAVDEDVGVIIHRSPFLGVIGQAALRDGGCAIVVVISLSLFHFGRPRSRVFLESERAKMKFEFENLKFERS